MSIDNYLKRNKYGINAYLTNKGFKCSQGVDICICCNQMNNKMTRIVESILIRHLSYNYTISLTYVSSFLK